MKSTKVDNCVLYRRGEKGLDGVTVLQVDDAYGHGSQDFIKNEDTVSNVFKCKPQKILNLGDHAMFNGTNICQDSDQKSHKMYRITQSEKLRKLDTVDTAKSFSSVRAQMQYVGCCTRPDICAEVQLLASGNQDPTKSEMKRLNKMVNRCIETSSTGLNYEFLDINSVRLALFTDASFANAAKLKSQIGYVLVLVDKDNRANIIHYGSSRCKRVTRSVMAAEVHGLMYGFDSDFIAKDMLEEILGRSVDLDTYVYSRTLFNVIAKDSAILEKRLQIDVFSIRESHKARELRNIAWIPGKENVADGTTKGLVPDSHPLWKLMTTNDLSVNPQGWVNRSPCS